MIAYLRLKYRDRNLGCPLKLYHMIHDCTHHRHIIYIYIYKISARACETRSILSEV